MAKRCRQADFELKVITKLTYLTTKMDELVGNGQPGRISLVEQAIDSLQRHRWIATGAIAVLTLLIGWALSLLPAMKK